MLNIIIAEMPADHPVQVREEVIGRRGLERELEVASVMSGGPLGLGRLWGAEVWRCKAALRLEHKLGLGPAKAGIRHTEMDGACKGGAIVWDAEGAESTDAWGKVLACAFTSDWLPRLPSPSPSVVPAGLWEAAGQPGAHARAGEGGG